MSTNQYYLYLRTNYPEIWEKVKSLKDTYHLSDDDYSLQLFIETLKLLREFSTAKDEITNYSTEAQTISSQLKESLNTLSDRLRRSHEDIEKSLGKISALHTEHDSTIQTFRSIKQEVIAQNDSIKKEIGKLVVHHNDFDK